MTLSDPPQPPNLVGPPTLPHLVDPPGREPSPGAVVRAGRDEVWPVRVDPSGRRGPTRNQSTGPHWRRTGPGLYVPTAIPRTVGQRIVEAAAVLPAYGAVTGWAALRWCGGAWFEGLRSDATTPLDVQLACDHRRPVPGITICEEGLDPSELTCVDGVRVTTPVRSVCFLMRYAYDLTAAVRALDMAAYNDLVSIAEVSDYAAHHNAWTGIPQCREALPHCDENAWSPCEVDMRLIWEREAELPRPLTNVAIFDLHGTDGCRRTPSNSVVR